MHGLEKGLKDMRDLRIAAVCMHAAPGDIDGNLRKTEAFVVEASRQGADVVCFPELSLSGYGLKDPETLCPPDRGEDAVRAITEMARTHELIILAGLIEWPEGQGPCISQIVAGPDRLMGRYRKTHLSPSEKDVYRPGNAFGVFPSGDILFGVQLCYEAHFPEISTLMALKGVQLVFVPHASPRGNPEEKRDSWLRHLPARAFDNAMFVVACNQVGVTDLGFSFPGVGMILNPAGRIVAEYTGNAENVLVADLKMAELDEIRGHRMRYFLPHRRPDLYGDVKS